MGMEIIAGLFVAVLALVAVWLFNRAQWRAIERDEEDEI